MGSNRYYGSIIFRLLCFTFNARAQPLIGARGINFVPPAPWDFVDTIVLNVPTNTMAGMTLTLPSVASTLGQALLGNGTNPDLLHWGFPSSGGRDSGYYIENLAYPFTVTQAANLNIGGNAGMNDIFAAGSEHLYGILYNVGGIQSSTESLSSTLIVMGNITNTTLAGSSGTGYGMIATPNVTPLGLLQHITGTDGQIPIFSSGGSIGAGNFVLANITAGAGIGITNGNGTITVKTDIDSVFTAGAGK